MKKGLIAVLTLSVWIGLLGFQAARAAVPQIINYQGTLTDKGGTPVPNGNYSIEFRIYDVASGGTVLWSEKWDTTTSQVAVVGGIFNAMLGFHSPIPTNLFVDRPVTYLAVKVGTDAEMLPRQRITSVGYAFNAGNGIPKGGIIMWSGSISAIPAGWALCDGNNGTPNLRDKFVLGAGGSLPVTGGATQVSIQHSHTMNHTHTFSGKTGESDYNRDRSTGSYSTAGDTHKHTFSGTTSDASSTSTSTATQAVTILPPYYALAYIMKL